MNTPQLDGLRLGIRQTQSSTFFFLSEEKIPSFVIHRIKRHRLHNSDLIAEYKY